MSSSDEEDYDLVSRPTRSAVIQTTKKAAAAKPRKGGKKSVIKRGAASGAQRQPKKRFYCAVENCPYSTSFAKDLTRHNRKHTGEKPFQCPRCDKSFSRCDKLHIHIRTHNEDRVYKCTSCNYAAVESGSLKKHIRTHTDERPFKCQLCNYSAKDSSQLVVHLRHHTGDTPYTCLWEGCDAAFKTTSDLQRHTRLHTGEKPYQCQHCSYKAAVKCNLNTHMRKHHPNNPNISEDNSGSNDNNGISGANTSVEPKKPVYERTAPYIRSSKNRSKITNLSFLFACKLCPFKADTMRSFSFHMRVIHNESTTKEDVAGISPSTLPAKKRKMAVTNDSFIFECPKCPATFVRENSLRCHMKQHSQPSLRPPIPVFPSDKVPNISDSGHVKGTPIFLTIPVSIANVQEHSPPPADPNIYQVVKEDTSKTGAIPTEVITFTPTSSNTVIYT